MKNVLFTLAISMSAVGSYYGQATPVPTIPEKGSVTLESRKPVSKKVKDNYVNAAYSFEKAANGTSGLAVTKNDWDIVFSSIRKKDGSVVKDVFSVSMVTDDRSRILDLGKLGWKEVRSVPVLPAFDKPSRENDVDAIAGHIYLVHTADRDSDLYALFRVDELKSGESVTINWRRIPPPKGQ